MEEKEERVELPKAANPLTRDEADRMIALIRLDIEKYRRERARFMGQVAEIEFLITESDVAIADIERRVANVDYPPAPAPEPEQPSGEGEKVSAGAEPEPAK